MYLKSNDKLLVYYYENMSLYTNHLLNRDTIKVSNLLNDTIIFHLYHMCQVNFEILNLKHKIKSSMYLKINENIILLIQNYIFI